MQHSPAFNGLHAPWLPKRGLYPTGESEWAAGNTLGPNTNPEGPISTTQIESYQQLNDSGQAGDAGRRVFEYIASQGADGATCFEVEAALGMLHQTASGRIKVLRSTLALIYCDGTTRVNHDTNRNCEVYRIVTDLEEAQRVDFRCGREGSAVRLDVVVVGTDPDNPESTKPVIQEEFSCFGWRKGMSFTLEVPKSVTLYEGDELRISSNKVDSIPE